MRANSFQIASVYTKAVLLLNLEESIFKTVVEEITTCSQFKMESLSLSQIQAIGFQKETKNVLRILFEQKKLFILPELARQLKIECIKISNSMVFRLSSATKIEENEIANLKKTLQEAFKKDIILEEKQEISLIGGFTLSFGSFLLDFSKKSQISKIKACILKE